VRSANLDDAVFVPTTICAKNNFKKLHLKL
jgi:hypothetical protein